MTSIPEMQALEDIANNNLRIQELAPELNRYIPTIAPALHDSILSERLRGATSLGNALALQAHMNALISDEHDRFSLLPLAEANSSHSDTDGTPLWRVYGESQKRPGRRFPPWISPFSRPKNKVNFRTIPK